MLLLSVENVVLVMLAILVISGLILLHYLLFREYVHQERVHLRRLNDFENLINQEIYRSQLLSKTADQLCEFESKTDEKLELLKLQVKSLDLLTQPPPFDKGGK